MMRLPILGMVSFGLIYRDNAWKLPFFAATISTSTCVCFANGVSPSLICPKKHVLLGAAEGLGFRRQGLGFLA